VPCKRSKCTAHHGFDELSELEEIMGKLKVTKKRLNDVAWDIARAISRQPKRKHTNETVINVDNKKGCIPMNCSTGILWCCDCFYKDCCLKLESPIQWFIHKDGSLQRR